MESAYIKYYRGCKTSFCSGGTDNAFTSFSIISQIRNGKQISCYLDDFQIISEIQNSPAVGFEEVRQRQQKKANSLAKEYGVIPFVGNEITGAGQHKNSYCTHVPVIDYYKRNFSVSHLEAIDWVKKHDGIFSINHPMSNWNRISLDEKGMDMAVDSVTSELIKSKCDGANMIEIGFPIGRYGFSLEQHLRIWDGLSLNGIFITGYGCSDNHRNNANWNDGNNFAVWIYAEEAKEKSLIESMDKGNLYTGDPAIFKGTLVLKTSEGFCMGQAVKATSEKYSLLFKITCAKEGWKVRWIVDGQIKKSENLCSDIYEDTQSISITKPLHFVRVEVFDENERCILLTNPIYFVNDDSINIPENRKAYYENLGRGAI